MKQLLEDRLAVITGGSRGIGRAIAIAFAKAGADLVLVARSQAALEEAASICRAEGAEVTTESCDVSDSAAVASLFHSLTRLDCLVNCAGVYGPIGPFAEQDMAAWADAVRVNLLGTVLACHAALPLLVRSGRGSIVNMSGGGATAPLPRFSSYAATKAAVVRFTETLAEELAGSGVRVNAIAPGAVDTQLQDAVLAAGEAAGPLFERIRSLRESGAGGTPPDLPAALAVFLASDASAPLSGRLVSAPHDGWREWNGERLVAIQASPWLTLRRLDPHTVDSLQGRP